MNKHGIVLKPIDTFFFRNHQSFTAGEDSEAEMVFPPHLSTVYGALRSAYIHQHSDFSIFSEGTDKNVRHWMGTPSTIGQFAIQGGFLCRMQKNDHDELEDIYFPIPLDYQIEDKADGKVLPLRLQKKDEQDYSSHHGSHYLYRTTEEKAASMQGVYVPYQEWIQALIDPNKINRWFKVTDWLQRNPKVGIGRNNKENKAIDTEGEGLLYRIDMSMFKDKELGLLVLTEDKHCPDLTQVPFARLGGENRPWTIHQLPSSINLLTKQQEQKIIQQVEKSNMARLVLLTPAIWGYHNGSSSTGQKDRIVWQENENEQKLMIDELEVSVLTSAVERPNLIGGWDIHKRRPKPRRTAIPAGSVFYIQVPEGQAEKIVTKIHETRLTNELSHEGYGISFCGVVQQ
ncbi:type III-B CRISPR module-associated Cmr3 family protein [Longirhabdus pacifica]|uniref:type III-B CRISPR module-associated Cmr3 family protein n=1 Tax=Longirhabdus pacifica TaxID=2305227 RepID=UPI0013E8A0B2|nr:type III-B CRISPR module-associated Cmr3 family protein [Longirhabdus pacifica]